VQVRKVKKIKMINISPLNNIKNVKEIDTLSIEGKTVVVRCDFNVPLTAEGKVIDDLRIRKTLPTIEFLISAGAKIVLISHIENKYGFGIRPVYEHLINKFSNIFNEKNLKWAENLASLSVCTGSMENSQMVLLDNLRKYPGEKENDLDFAQELKTCARADIYINDGFAVSHRRHASVSALPKMFDQKSRFSGMQLYEEIKNISEALNPSKPFVFILGGAKFETKIPLIDKFTTGPKSADSVVLGGALLNDILKAKGLSVGKSLVSDLDLVGLSADDMQVIANNSKLIIPTDVVVSDIDKGDKEVVTIENVAPNKSIYDVGPSLLVLLEEQLKDAKFVLWNGPMGNYENGYKEQTMGVARLIIKYTTEGDLKALIGGGDTTASMAELGMDNMSENKNLFVSTGGGAMLEFLLDESLPGVDVLVG
jgi:phosphoglycerate kinase